MRSTILIASLICHTLVGISLAVCCYFAIQAGWVGTAITLGILAFSSTFGLSTKTDEEEKK